MMIVHNEEGFVYGMRTFRYTASNGKVYSRRRKYVMAYCDKCDREQWIRADNANRLIDKNVNSGKEQLEYTCAYCRPVGAKLDLPEID